jgi:hypothetical protein
MRDRLKKTGGKVGTRSCDTITTRCPIINNATTKKYRATGGIQVFYAFYALAIIVLILHFNGWLKRHNMEWLVLLIAALTFPVILFLR